MLKFWLLVVTLMVSSATAEKMHPDELGYEAIYAKQMIQGINMVHSLREPFNPDDPWREYKLPLLAVNASLVLDTSTYNILEFDLINIANQTETKNSSAIYRVNLMELDSLENVTMNRVFVMYWMDGNHVSIDTVFNSSLVRVMAEPFGESVPNYTGWPLLAMPRGEVLTTYASNVMPANEARGILAFTSEGDSFLWTWIGVGFIVGATGTMGCAGFVGWVRRRDAA